MIVELDDGLNEYTTSYVERVLAMVSTGNLYVQTRNSKYRLRFK